MKNGRRIALWTSGIAFAAFSVAAGLGLLRSFDLWTLRTAQSRTSATLDAIGNLFSTLGNFEVAGAAMAVLLVAFYTWGRRKLAVRLLIVFVTTGLVELAMKMLLPQAQIPVEVARSSEAPLLELPYPYPSGHMLRFVLLFGAIMMLWKSQVARAVIVLALAGMAASRVYMGVHWASDVIGGALLGVAGLTWAFQVRKGG